MGDVSPGDTLGSTTGFGTTAPPGPTFAPEDALNIITVKWNALGGEPGPAITPGIDGVQSVAEPPCWFIEFQNGVIYREHGDTFYVKGAILARYKELGGPQSFLGRARSDELPTGDGQGRFSAFENGRIYWSQTTGPVELAGAWRQHWEGLGEVGSYLGYPTKAVTDGVAHFEKGAVHVRGDFIFDASDARVIDPGRINIDGAPVHAHLTLTLSAAGSWEYKGKIETAGALSHDVQLATTLEFTLPDGRVLAWNETGDVEGFLVLGGHTFHDFHQFGMDDRIKQNWRQIKAARAKTVLTVETGAGDILAVVATVLGIPLAAIAIVVAGLTFSDTHDICPPVKRERWDPIEGRMKEVDSMAIVPKGHQCPTN